jgi:hypothetical protein
LEEKKMKKLIIATVASASLLLASSSFALKSMDDSSMKDATAQAGVTIALDNVILETWTGASGYVDVDGNEGSILGMSGANTALVISDKHTVMKLNAFGFLAGNFFTGPGHVGPTADLATVSASKFDATDATQFGYHDSATGGTYGYGLRIDMGTCDAITLGATLATAAVQADPTALAANIAQVNGVVIGLPTLEIHTSADSYDVGFTTYDAATDTLAALDVDSTLIKVVKGAKTTRIYGGHVEIAAH